jgi:hypothetical protein
MMNTIAQKEPKGHPTNIFTTLHIDYHLELKTSFSTENGQQMMKI